jgi:hypothetical protein
MEADVVKAQIVSHLFYSPHRRCAFAAAADYVDGGDFSRPETTEGPVIAHPIAKLLLGTGRDGRDDRFFPAGLPDEVSKDRRIPISLFAPADGQELPHFCLSLESCRLHNCSKDPG